MTKLDAKRAMLSANIQDTERRLDAMKIQLQQSRPTPLPPDADSKLQQLRETVTVEGAVASDQAGSDIGMPLFSAGGKIFIPNCVEELQEWTTNRSPRYSGGEANEMQLELCRPW